MRLFNAPLLLITRTQIKLFFDGKFCQRYPPTQFYPQRLGTHISAKRAKTNAKVGALFPGRRLVAIGITILSTVQQLVQDIIIWRSFIHIGGYVYQPTGMRMRIRVHLVKLIVSFKLYRVYFHTQIRKCTCTLKSPG